MSTTSNAAHGGSRGLWLAVLLLIVCLGMSVPSMAKGSSGCGYNVTSVLYDSDNQVPAQPFQYQSDGLGPYTTFRASGNNSVSSIIQSSCSWALDTTGSTTRGIRVTLAYPYSGVTTPPPFTIATDIHGVFHTQCFDNPANGSLNFGTMTFVGQTIACPMHLVFTYN